VKTSNVREAPSTRFQAPKKLQTSKLQRNSKPQTQMRAVFDRASGWSLKFGAWCFFGAWILVLL
jgi:hypothetical protein